MAGKRYSSIIFRRITAASNLYRIRPVPFLGSNSKADRGLCTRVALGMFTGAAAGIYLEDLCDCKAKDEMSWYSRAVNDLTAIGMEIRKSMHVNGLLHNLTHASSDSFNSFSIPKAITGYPVSIDDGSSEGKSEGPCLNRYSIANAAARAAPAVVNITATIGIHSMLLGKSSGSGFVIHPDGTILTNAHVVADAGKGPHTGKLVVTMQDGRTFSGEVVNYDLLTDIAVVKVRSKIPLPTVKVGSSQMLRPGEWVVALGSPLHLQNSVTVGIISCVDRKSSEIGLHGAHTEYIQTDAAINQGNSGGPLLNLDGEVIGINTMKAITADGVSFAIPIDLAIKIVEQLKKHGRVVRPWLGMKMLELTEPIIGQLKERDPAFPDINKGVLVPQVIPGSPAERGGIRPGDVIVQFDGKPISSVNQIVEALGDKTGVGFEVVVKRAHNQQFTIIVVTEEATPSF
ncbi:hypothetical protein O6H91_10G054400 [Diphasiastrum complanatum]|uniref:Uncharacterized protein n=1 Tax=Diphasiastrum complanatum TaxID=34168 RepID=A0ACC2CH50_DIPCM|nr:hypothetical protein O6H91_10G054400 [Diphasiastrum complanatum]